MSVGGSAAVSGLVGVGDEVIMVEGSPVKAQIASDVEDRMLGEPGPLRSHTECDDWQ